MNLFTTTAAALCITASQASALSCLPMDVARSFQDASTSEKTYVVLHGSFSFAARPVRGDEQNPQTQSYAGLFSGKLLTGAGFTNEISEVLVDINSNCAASWCGEITPDADYIAFVEQDGTRLTLQAEACPNFAFIDPTPDMVRKVETCVAGGNCEPEN